MNSSLYRGRVVHARMQPFRHRFSYRSWMMLADLDELPGFDRSSWLFGYNRFALASFHDRDFGRRDGSPLRGWAESLLTGAGLGDAAESLSILCLPRILGFTFNPISLVFCRDRMGSLRAVLVQVNNTWGGRHTYLLPVGVDRPVNARAAKRLAVSPFTPMDADYAFTLSDPGSRFAMSVVLGQDGHALLHTAFAGRSEPFSERALGRCLASIPLITLRTFAAIHWQAVKLLLRGARFAPASPYPTEEMSVGR